MGNLKEAIKQLSEAISKTTELFYTQREGEGYVAFGELLDPLMTIMNQLFTAQTQTGKPEFDQQEILRLLQEAMKAMENRDGVLLADILQYDFLDQLEQIADQLD